LGDGKLSLKCYVSQEENMRALNILGRIRAVLGSVDTPAYNEDYIFDEMNQVQRFIAEDTLSLENSYSLNLIAGTQSYDLTYQNGDTTKPTGFYRLKLVSPPQGSRILPLQEVDVNRWDLIQRFTYQSLVTPILYYKIWNGVLTFFPTPQSTTTFVIYYFQTPTTSISRTVDPQLSGIFDKCLEYGTIKEIAPALGQKDLIPLYEEKYASAMQRAMDSRRRIKTVSNQIQFIDVG
jgi:hypothetical protein